jgi:D-alanyl-D-alanine carboxypeptidase (penicillin-binding protein 5/6)
LAAAIGCSASCVWLSTAALAGTIEPPKPLEPPRVTARAALVMDADTGAVLWERNGDVPLPPASTTKILTTVLALESGRLDDAFPVSAHAQAQAPSKIDLRAGQRVRLMDLVYALMLKSANDAAVVVAEGLGGSVDGFADAMNRRARELGATQTRFRNPHGLPNAEHVSSARDLAHILRHALSVPGFRGVAATPSTEVPVIQASSATRLIPVRSHNRLLSGYPVPVVGKTGYTRAAGRCYAAAATLDGRETIIVLLGSSNLWGDARKLIAYGLTALAPDAARGVQFAATDPPGRKRAGVRKTSKTKKAHVAQGKPKRKGAAAARSTGKSSSKGSAARSSQKSRSGG